MLVIVTMNNIPSDGAGCATAVQQHQQTILLGLKLRFSVGFPSRKIEEILLVHENLDTK